ncbi:hypothetical protein BDZ97DRAFT_1922992 [Flammula alnicola]|nr:hypothetical protein BDZ97DRAFT_1922992 [Flammula alnicola]
MFDLPPLDGSLGILEVIEHNGINNSKHLLFRYEDPDGGIRTISWGDATEAFDIATGFVLEHVTSVKARADTRAPPVVGILANLDSITYYSLTIGIMRAGFTPFLISTRNSADGVAHLLAATDCGVLFTTDDTATHQLTTTSCNLFREANPNKESISVVMTPTFDQLYRPKEREDGHMRAFQKRKIVDQRTAPCVILHSSGTVSFPKPIILTYRMVFEHGIIPRQQGDFRGYVLSAHAIPLYHMMGFILIPWTAMLGVTISVFHPSRPAVIPAPELVLRGAVATSSSHIFCASSFLETWAYPSNLEALKTFQGIIYGGGPLQINVGDYLVKEGVKLTPMFGLTETGPITTFFPKHIETEGWIWFELNSHLDFGFIREESEDGVFRIAVKESSIKMPAVLNTVVDGVRAFDTKDLVIRHPTNPNLWKLYGRADEQIMHSTGEKVMQALIIMNGIISHWTKLLMKTNPLPIENMIVKSPYISAAVMFGRARFQPGVLILPPSDYILDRSDRNHLDDYLSLIWETVAEANRHSPQHSKIFRDMILIAHPDKPFEYTSKGTIRRQITLAKYEEDIKRLYESDSGSGSDSSYTSTFGSATSASDISNPGIRDFGEIATFVRAAIINILGQINDEDNIFQAGADSLCALSIRNSIIRSLRQSGLMRQASIRGIPRDIIYIFPSISLLSAFLYGAIIVDNLRSKNQTASGAENGNEVETIQGDDGTSGADTKDIKWQLILESKETVVEIAPGSGEPPLMLIHGAPGMLETFPMFMECTSAVWGIQITEDAPQDSVEELAAFYYQKIKEKQPHGPYRFASYSGSCVLVLELVMLAERHGDTVIQFAMLDHFPTLFFPKSDPSNVDITNPEWWQAYFQESVQGMLYLLARTEGVLGRQAALRHREMEDALNGLPGTPSSRKVSERAGKQMRMSVQYMFRDEFLVDGGSDTGQKRWSLELFRNFVSRIKARLTLYIATEGIREIFPAETKRQLDEDLGARALFPDVDIVYIDGGHLDFLEHKTLLMSMEGDYYVG